MKFTPTILSVFTIFFLNSFLSIGQAGYIDQNFNRNIYEKYPNGFYLPGTQKITANHIQNDGKILIGTDMINGILRRLNPDASIDTTFNNSSIYNSKVYDIDVQTDNKIIVVGSFDVYINNICSPYKNIIRLNPNGSIDTTFNLTCQTYGYIRSIKIQDDGKILIGGNFTYSGNYKNLIRLNQNGTIDTSFNMNIFIYDGITNMDLQSNGKIIAWGDLNLYLANEFQNIVRFEADGSLDSTFNVGYSAGINTIIVQPDDKILISGSFSNIQGFARKGIARLESSGNIDLTFDPGIGAPSGTIKTIFLLSNNKILVGGSFTSYNYISIQACFVRLYPDGNLDQTLNSSILNTDGPIDLINVGPNGNILLCGQFEGFCGKYRNKIASLKSDYSFDDSFNPKPGFSGDYLHNPINPTVNYGISAPQITFVQPNGKIFVAGIFKYYNDTITNQMVRLKKNGTIDTTFFFNEWLGGTILTAILQSDGKILVGGNIAYVNGQNSRYGLMRIHENGSLDTSFNPDFGIGSHIKKIILQNDGKILLLGQFSEFNGTQVNNIIRLNLDGSLDINFNVGAGTNGQIHTGEITESGKIIISGIFSQYNDVSRNNVALLNSDGSLDLQFNPGSGPNSSSNPIVESILSLPNGKFILAGNFDSYNNQPCKNIAWINSNGDFDSTFQNIGIGYQSFYQYISTLKKQPDGKILIAGKFDFFNNLSGLNIVRILENGEIDSSFLFNNTSGTHGLITNFSLLNNGQILLIGGDINSYNISYNYNVMQNNVILLQNDIDSLFNLQLHFSNINNISCINPGSVTAYATGVPFFSYQWENFTTNDNSIQVINTPGIYNCTVTNTNGESNSSSILIEGPSSSGFDLKQNLFANCFRPGFQSSIGIDAFNEGCIPTSGQLKLIHDSLLTFVSSVPSPSYQIGDTLIWNYSEITYDSLHVITNIEFTVSPLAIIGDSITLHSIITPINNDTDSTNNFKKYKFPVVNGYDPNIKSVYPIGECTPHFIDSNELLTYTIQFQNTGNSEAINIMVLDSLDPDLDINSVRIVGKSHNMWTEVVEGNILKFHFDNINLIDSTTNEVESHGYLIYEVKPSINTIPGSIIKNDASIFFDFNSPIYTNYVFNTISDGSEFINDTITVTAIDQYNLNSTIYNETGSYIQTHINNYGCEVNIVLNLTIQSTDGINEISQSQFTIFPNPSYDNITLDFGQKLDNINISISDIQGVHVFNKSNLTGEKVILDISNLKTGIYFLSIKDGLGKTYNEKIKISKIN